MTSENIKNELWKIFKYMGVSMVIICDIEGNIIWHRGRKSSRCKIDEREKLKKMVKDKLRQSKKNEARKHTLELLGRSVSVSEKATHLVTNFIFQLYGKFFLYIDVEIKKIFREGDIRTLKMMGELLGRIVTDIYKKEDDTLWLLGSSEATRKIRETVEKYALEEDPVLIVGETGVGKSHVAEKIHRYSGRRGRFVVAEVATVNENLLESILFGHKKGSFTNAYSDEKGLVHDAEGGTLFFDEIAEIPRSVQAKLLRFIDTKRYRVLGEIAERDADVRIIAATNKNLNQAIAQGEFRLDLYFRLQVLEVEIPPLRDRKEDIKVFVQQTSRKYLRGKELGEKFWDAMFSYEWPGNVRELITVLKRAGLLLESPITGDAITEIILNLNKKTIIKSDSKADEIWKGIVTGKNFWDIVWKPFLAREIDRYFVKDILKKAYKAGLKNFKKMNYILNIDSSDYHKFMSLMHRYRIDPRG